MPEDKSITVGGAETDWVHVDADVVPSVPGVHVLGTPVQTWREVCVDRIRSPQIEQMTDQIMTLEGTVAELRLRIEQLSVVKETRGEGQ